MRDHRDYLISKDAPIKEALSRLDEVSPDAILFLVGENDQLVGSLTDGDVRRGLLQGLGMEDSVEKFSQTQPKVIRKGEYSVDQVIALREGRFELVPVLDTDDRIVNIINFRFLRSYLPVDAVIMAGGRGSRLKPLTDTMPKPLLKIGEKPIMEHNVDRLRKFGVDDFWFSVRYLGDQIEAYFGDGSSRQVNIEYVWEDQPLGTIGAVSKIDNFKHDYVLVTNSDLLTTLNYESFFLDFIAKDSDMSVVTIPYSVNIPYAVLETSNNHVLSFKEKPTYTYYSNGGIYLIKRKLFEMIPKNSFFNSTDLMEEVIRRGMTLTSFPVRDYWLDIGKHEDFAKAQEDISHLRLD